MNYEEGAEYSLLDGDCNRETNNEVPSPLPINQRDLANESVFEYGSRVGIWRLLNCLNKYEIKATFFCCALALERNPYVGPSIVKAGHEVFGHGYRWEEYFKMDVQAERDAIHRTINSLKQTTGVRPLGWYVRYGPSEQTRELIVEEGGFMYDSMAYNDDLPYYTIVKGKKWLVVPYSLEVNDTKFWRGGMISPNDFYETMKNTFDVLYEEGATHPKMMSIGLHCRISGKPSRIKVVNEFLDYALSHTDVWFARRVDIAQWWLKNFQ